MASQAMESEIKHTLVAVASRMISFEGIDAATCTAHSFFPACHMAAEEKGAERKHLASVVNSAVNVRLAGHIMTLTARAATTLRGAAMLKALALKEVWNMAMVMPVEKRMGEGGGNDNNCGGSNNGVSNDSFSSKLVPEENFLGILQSRIACQRL